MKCDVCEIEIEDNTDYRVLTLSYVTEKTPEKKSPYRKEYMGVIMGTSNIYFSQGYNTYVDKAKICMNCQERLDEILEQMRIVFHPLKGSASE